MSIKINIVLLFSLLFVFASLQAQSIREMKARQIEPPAGFTIMRSNPEDGGLIIYSAIPNLRFESNMNGIVKIIENPLDGKYTLFLKTILSQIIVIKSIGYLECRIHVRNLQAQEVRYYVLEDVSEGMVTGSTLPVVFNVTPADAVIKVGSKVFKSGESQILPIGKNEVNITKEGYHTIKETIEVSETRIQFNYNLRQVDLALVSFNSDPEDANIYINNSLRGKTNRNLFLYPGTYDLKISKNNYQEVIDTIYVQESLENVFSYKLNKNHGVLILNTIPDTARVYLNNEQMENNGSLELSPSTYKLDVKADSFKPYSEVFEIKIDERLEKNIYLMPIYGDLMLLVKPTDAISKIYRNNSLVKTVKGSQIIKDLLVGDYNINITANNYKSLNGIITIKESEKSEISFELVKGKDDIIISSDTYIDMAYIEGGSFRMGNSTGEIDEKPAHLVSISPFYIGKYEVSQSEWFSVMQTNPSEFKGDNLPVENVSWFDAVNFCNNLSLKENLTPAYLINGSNIICNWAANGYRLPTEAEWEFAAKGGNRSNDYTYSGSNSIENVGWFASNSNAKTNNVGSKKSNELGLYDMSGNVYEWCWDWYDASYYRDSQANNPLGASSEFQRVIRSGSIYNEKNNCRVTNREHDFSYNKYSYLGFRVAKSDIQSNLRASMHEEIKAKTKENEKKVRPTKTNGIDFLMYFGGTQSWFYAEGLDKSELNRFHYGIGLSGDVFEFGARYNVKGQFHFDDSEYEVATELSYVEGYLKAKLDLGFISPFIGVSGGWLSDAKLTWRKDFELYDSYPIEDVYKQFEFCSLCGADMKMGVLYLAFEYDFGLTSILEERDFFNRSMMLSLGLAF